MLVLELTSENLIQDIKSILLELKKYSEELFNKDRWLVLNKIDITDKDLLQQVKEEIVNSELKDFGYSDINKIFAISAVTHENTKDLIYKLSDALNERSE